MRNRIKVIKMPGKNMKDLRFSSHKYGSNKKHVYSFYTLKVSVIL